jgi:hypothetical protein
LSVPPNANQRPGRARKRSFTPLPADYKDFIDAYGPGYVSEFIWVLSPFIDNEYYNLVRQAELQLGALRELKAKHKKEVP